MALTDFLFNGSPPASTTTYGSSTSSLPAWYNDYTQGLISKANAIAATPYQGYNANNTVGSTGAVDPNTGKPYVGNEAFARIAGFQPSQNQAFQNVANLTGQYQNQTDANGNITGGAFAPAAQNIGAATTGTALSSNQNAPETARLGMKQYENAGNYNPYTQGVGGIDRAMSLTGQNVGQSSVGNINSYMSPYTDKVVDYAGELGRENLNNTLSNVGDRFIGGGSFGGSRMGQSLGAAARAGQRDITGAQANLLNTGYNQALNASQADLARQLQGAGQYGSLGSQRGALAGQAQQNYANIGNQLGQLSQSDLARQLQGGQAQQNLAQTAASTGLQQNAALEAAGAQQQNLQQQSLNQAYQDFQNQVNYPSQQASFLNSIIRGLQIPTTQQTSATGPASVYQPSPLSQLAAAGTGFAGLSKALG